MHFICRPFIGKNDQSLWSQYWENEPDDDQKFTKGHLFGLINIKNQQSEPITIGRDIIFEINRKVIIILNFGDRILTFKIFIDFAF